jgi:hypothetical protein
MMSYKHKKSLILSLFFLIKSSIFVLGNDVTTVLKRPVLDVAEQEAITAYLGYNPHITEYRLSTFVENEGEKSCTVYCHGFGEYQGVIPYLLEGLYLQGVVIGFNFPDTAYDPFDTASGHSVVMRNVSLAQKKDQDALKATLVALTKKGYSPIHLFGNSRGGGTVIATMHALIDMVKKAEQVGVVEKEGAYITLKDIATVLSAIQNGGTIQLNAPMLNVSEVIKFIIEKGLRAVQGVGLCSKICSTLYLTQLFKTGLYYSGHYCLLPMLTRGYYSPSALKPIDAATTLKGFDVPIFLRFNLHDGVLPPTDDARAYQALMGPKTHLIISEYGTHNRWDAAFIFQLNAFRKKYGAVHFARETLSSEYQLALYDQAEDIIEHSSQPTEYDVAAYAESCG